MNVKQLPNNEAFIIPEYYIELDPVPDDPPYTTPYGYQGKALKAFALVYPIDVSDAMPFGHPEMLITGIHQQLGEEQGLIAVKDGETKAGREYIYSIVKTLKGKGMGVQYNLTMHIFFGSYVMNITGFFDEDMITGVRDTQVFSYMMNEGIIKGPVEWCRDPYDADYKKGILMNRSEEEQFDKDFPWHPLTEARNFVKFVIENN